MRRKLILPAVVLFLVSRTLPPTSTASAQDIGEYGCPVVAICNYQDLSCMEVEPHSLFPIKTGNAQCGFCPSIQSCGVKWCGPGGVLLCKCGPKKTSGYTCDSGEGC